MYLKTSYLLILSFLLPLLAFTSCKHPVYVSDLSGSLHSLGRTYKMVEINRYTGYEKDKKLYFEGSVSEYTVSRPAFHLPPSARDSHDYFVFTKVEGAPSEQVLFAPVEEIAENLPEYSTLTITPRKYGNLNYRLIPAEKFDFSIVEKIQAKNAASPLAEDTNWQFENKDLYYIKTESDSWYHYPLMPISFCAFLIDYLISNPACLVF